MKAVALLDSAQCSDYIDLNLVTNQWKAIDFLPHIGWNTYRRYSWSTKFPILLHANTIQLYLRHAGDHIFALSAGYKLAAALKSLDPQGPQSLIPNARHQLPIARFANSCSALIRTFNWCYDINRGFEAIIKSGFHSGYMLADWKREWGGGLLRANYGLISAWEHGLSENKIRLSQGGKPCLVLVFAGYTGPSDQLLV